MKFSLNLIIKILSALTILFLFFTWFTYEASTKALGETFSTGFSLSGFYTVGADLVPIALVILIIKGGDLKEFGKLYLYAAIAGIVMTILVGLIYPSVATSIKVSGVSEDMSWGLGLWLSLVDYVAILVLTLIDMKKDGSDVEGEGSFKDKLNAFIQRINTKVTRTIILGCIAICYFLPFVKEYGLHSYSGDLKTINYELQHTFSGFEFIGKYWWPAAFLVIIVIMVIIELYAVPKGADKRVLKVFAVFQSVLYLLFCTVYMWIMKSYLTNKNEYPKKYGTATGLICALVISLIYMLLVLLIDKQVEEIRDITKEADGKVKNVKDSVGKVKSMKESVDKEKNVKVSVSKNTNMEDSGGASAPTRLFCAYCGSKLKNGAVFCTKCGKKVGG